MLGCSGEKILHGVSIKCLAIVCVVVAQRHVGI